MFQYQSQQIEMQLQDISQYINRIQQLETFLQNVSLQIPTINRRQVFSNVASQMNKSFSTHNLKVVKLWVMFLSRMDSVNFGVTIIHVALLQFLVKQQLFKQALKFVSTLRLPLTILLAKYRQYLLLSVQVYLEYQDYAQALQALNVANSIEQRHIQPQFFTLKMLILTSLLINKQVQKNNFIRDMDKMKLSCKQQIQQWIHQRPQKIGQLQFQINMFCNICENKLLRQEQLRYLQQKGLLQLYLKSQSSKVKQLRKYIQKNIYNPILYRIKCTQIKDQPISQFQTVKNLNFPSIIFKYDKKNSIMYFNHRKTTQQELNQEIDKICEMQQVIKTRPNIKYEQMEMDRYDADEMEEESKLTRGFIGKMVGGFFGKRL